MIDSKITRYISIYRVRIFSFFPSIFFLISFVFILLGVDNQSIKRLGSFRSWKKKKKRVVPFKYEFDREVIVVVAVVIV